MITVTLWASGFSPMWFGVGAIGTGLLLAGVALYRGYRKERDVNNSG